LAWRGEGGTHCGASELVGEASGDLERRRPNLTGLGFRFCKRTRGKGRTTAPRAYPQRRYFFYRPRRAAAFIGSVHEAAANRAPGSAPRSCLLTRGWRRRTNRYRVGGSGWCWAGLDFGQMGCGQVSGLPLFFLLLFFSLFSVFCFAIC
jgi:hypothetical protein